MPRHIVHARESWRQWVTPKPLMARPVHWWYVFPHSFASELVHQLIEEWELGAEDRILDPFSGAGTTILAAKEKNVPAVGYDISPLAVLATCTKITDYDAASLEKNWELLKWSLEPSRWHQTGRHYPELVHKALPGDLLVAFEHIAAAIAQLPSSVEERDFFRLALIATLAEYSHTIANGGWVRFVDRHVDAMSIPNALGRRVQSMLQDVRETSRTRPGAWQARLGDVRQLPDEPSLYSAVITSPPYPNHTTILECLALS